MVPTAPHLQGHRDVQLIASAVGMGRARGTDGLRVAHVLRVGRRGGQPAGEERSARPRGRGTGGRRDGGDACGDGSRGDAAPIEVFLYFHPEDTRFGREPFHLANELFHPHGARGCTDGVDDGGGDDDRVAGIGGTDAHRCDWIHSRTAVLPNAHSIVQDVAVHRPTARDGRDRSADAAAAAAAAANANSNCKSQPASSSPAFECRFRYCMALDVYIRHCDFEAAVAELPAQGGALPPDVVCHGCRQCVTANLRTCCRCGW
jgi:hypothetical protein